MRIDRDRGSAFLEPQSQEGGTGVPAHPPTRPLAAA